MPRILSGVFARALSMILCAGSASGSAFRIVGTGDGIVVLKTPAEARGINRRPGANPLGPP